MMHAGGTWFGGWMWLWPLFGLAVTGLILWGVLSGTGDAPAPPGKTAEEILRERYARGEIDEEEFRRRLAELRK